MYSTPYARHGHRQDGGQFAPDWDAPRNWEAPYWKDRAEAALIQAGDLLRARLQNDEYANEMLGIFWAAFPDDWMNRQPWRELALSAEAMRNYLLHLPSGARVDVAAMIEAYRRTPASVLA